MRQEPFTLSQKELQRVTVISRCAQGNHATVPGWNPALRRHWHGCAAYGGDKEIFIEAI